MDLSVMKQPRGLYILAFGELCERFSYYGAQTILVLYLTKVFSFNDEKSYTLYGIFATFAYALPVLGGMLADRLLGLRQALILGGILLIVGNILLAFHNFNLFSIGLAATACGIGLYKPNSTASVGMLYNKEDENRDSGFTFFYMAMNIGATASPFIYGFATQRLGYHYEYIISATILTLSLIVFIFNKNYILRSSTQLEKKPKLILNIFCYTIIFFTCGIISLLFLYPAISNVILAAVIILTISILITLSAKHNVLERKRLLALLILSIFGMCFFAASLQVGSSINLFTSFALC